MPDRLAQARLIVEVRPRAGRNEILVPDGDVVRVRVTAAPAAGAANDAVRDLLARALDCARSSVEILRGHSARTKLIRIDGVSQEDAMTRLAGGRNPAGRRRPEHGAPPGGTPERGAFPGRGY